MSLTALLSTRWPLRRRAIGLLFRRGIPERVSKTVMIGLGLCVRISAFRVRVRAGAS